MVGRTHACASVSTPRVPAFTDALRCALCSARWAAPGVRGRGTRREARHWPARASALPTARRHLLGAYRPGALKDYARDTKGVRKVYFTSTQQVPNGCSRVLKAEVL
jgi:hypothetical protein